jgi:hypothetical protein
MVENMYKNWGIYLRLVYLLCWLNNIYNTSKGTILSIREDMTLYLTMNIIYWCMTLVDSSLMIISIVKGELGYQTAAVYVQIVKNFTGLLDLEGVINMLDPLLYVLYTSFMIAYTQFFFNASKIFKHQLKFEIFLCLYFSFCFIRGFGFFNLDTFISSFESLARVFIGFAVSICVLNFNKMVRNNLFTRIDEINELKGEFKQILDNLEESIIIIQDQTVDFVNEKFLREFHESFKDIKVNPKPKPTKTSWVQNLIQKIRNKKVEEAPEESNEALQHKIIQVYDRSE